MIRTVAKPSKRKLTGAHYTPPELARFVAQRILSEAVLNVSDYIRVLDPACGDGELLLAFADTINPKYLERLILVGYESDKSAIDRANTRLMNLPIKGLELIADDFLELSKKQFQRQPGLLESTHDDKRIIDQANIIIANPPYVRTQHLGSEKAQELAETFQLSGRVDLYHAFLIAMTNYLVPFGVLGVITSNRFLYTKGGTAIREFMVSKYDIRELYDLGDTKLFEAAVLPAIFVGRKRIESDQQKINNNVQSDAKFFKIYEILDMTNYPNNPRHKTSIYSALEDTHEEGDYGVGNRYFSMTRGLLTLPSDVSEPWSMITIKEQGWLDKINLNTRCRIGDLTKVRVGIKTTADEVFIRSNWDSLPDKLRPERNVLRPLLSHDDAERWRLKKGRTPSKYVLYTHEEIQGRRHVIDLSRYPCTKAYLTSHRPRLEGRKYVIEAKRKWYEIWVPQNPSAWKLPKIVFPDISPEPKFFYDGEGSIVDGNCYWITVDDDVDLLYLIMGIANTRLMTRYHDLTCGNKLYSGRRRYLTQYVEKYPLVDRDSQEGKKIVSVVRDLVFDKLPGGQIKDVEQKLEELVASAFGVAPVLIC